MKTMLISLLFAILLTGCSSITKSVNTNASIKPMTLNTSTDPSTFETQTIPLNFQPAPNPPEPTEITAQNVSLKMKIATNFVVYEKKENDNLYLGKMKIQSDTIDEYGIIAGTAYLDHIKNQVVQVFGKKMIWISGLCSGTCSMNYFFEENSEKLFLVINSFIQIADVDNDGENEILGTNATPVVDMFLYKQKNNQIVSAHLNSALNTNNGVSYDEKQHLFIAPFENGDRTYRYDSNEEGLIPIQNGN